MPPDYPRAVTDAFLLHAANVVFQTSMTNVKEHQREGAVAVYTVPFDEVVRIAMEGRYQVGTIYEAQPGIMETFTDDAWSIPRDRVLQFASLLRYMHSGEHDWEMQPLPTPTQILGMADAWALRQGLFRQGDDYP